MLSMDNMLTPMTASMDINGGGGGPGGGVSYGRKYTVCAWATVKSPILIVVVWGATVKSPILIVVVWAATVKSPILIVVVWGATVKSPILIVVVACVKV